MRLVLQTMMKLPSVPDRRAASARGRGCNDVPWISLLRLLIWSTSRQQDPPSFSARPRVLTDAFLLPSTEQVSVEDVSRRAGCASVTRGKRAVLPGQMSRETGSGWHRRSGSGTTGNRLESPQRQEGTNEVETWGNFHQNIGLWSVI